MTVNQNRLPLWKYALPPAAVPIVAAHPRERETRRSAACGVEAGRGPGERSSLLPPPSREPEASAGSGTLAAGLAGLRPAGLVASPRGDPLCEWRFPGLMRKALE